MYKEIAIGSFTLSILFILSQFVKTDYTKLIMNAIPWIMYALIFIIFSWLLGFVLLAVYKDVIKKPIRRLRLRTEDEKE